ncbi:ABC transporter ATP-binding protein [Actinomadura violacea]|uniref:ABC transporter ATP-binding protein n=1 Tax=Actinomadura violacea TaxID=2819934 RepID=A0ABS3RK13_9ACTN|nr:ABC transporter ATP-binding protein [Actinomadura violacea]MBO2456918.1 ABC transporter ATP-binding protein [Actinomadura violacea]
MSDGTNGRTGRGLAALLRPERLRLSVVAVFGVLAVATLLTGPQILGRATDILFDGLIGKSLPAGTTKAQAIASLRAHGHGHIADMLAGMDIVPGAGVDFARLGRVLGLAALVYVLGAAFYWAQGYLLAGVSQRIVHRLRRDVEEKLARLPLSYFDSRPHGDLLSRVTNDVDNIGTTLNEGLSPLLISVPMLAGVLGMMFWISPLPAAVSLAGIPLMMGLTVAAVRRSKPWFTAQWERTGRLNGLVEETHSGHALVLAFGRRRPAIEEFREQNERLYEAGFRAQFLSGVILPAIQFVGNLNFVVVAVLGGYQVATGVISLGAMQAFIQYSQRFTTPVAQIAGQLNAVQSGLASVERVFELLAAPEEEALPALDDGREGDEKVGAAGRIELRSVCFRYHPDTPLIEDFSLEAAPGQTVAIVGPTGAGKTTVVNLLMRFYEIDAGQILLDGVDYRDLGRDQVRRCFGMVLQDTWLFAGTIRDNIAYGRDDATDEEVMAAAKAAYVDDFVRTLPDGYSTVIDGDASGISSGQRQLLTIARAFLADRGILILDEATSHVDTRTEVLIQDAMARLRAGRTSFVIAHRLSTISNADVIVVMDGGRIVEQGAHEDLLLRRGLYHELCAGQFSAGDSLTP